MKRRRGSTGLLAVGLLLALMSLYLGPTPVAYAATIAVTTEDDELNTDGDCSLREAIQAANTDTAVDGCTAGSGADTITLPAGFYTLTILGAGENANASGDLDITGDLTINGVVGSTVIQAGTTIHNGIDRVLDVRSGSVELNHLWIEYGRTPGTTGEQNGGGIRVETAGILSLNNSYLTSHTAHWYGGGIFNRGELRLTNTTVGNNSAVFGGGGILNSDTLTLTDSTVANNAATYSGGGIWNNPTCTLSLTNSSIHSNRAGIGGGGILNEGGTLTLYDSLVAYNTADSDHDLSGNGGGIWNGGPLELYGSAVAYNDAAHGGGIYNDSDSTVILSQSAVFENECAYHGGGIHSTDPSAMLILHRSTVDGNDAAMGNGGGFYHDGGELTLNTCTVSGNTSGQSGGGIYIAAGTLSLRSATIANNAADADGDGSGDGGGIYVSSATARARNTILGNNSDWHPKTPDCWGTLTSQGYNLLEDTSGCTFTPTTGDITGSDPKLGALGNNGGPTWTHALLGGSPAIDRIPEGTSDCQAGVSVDQRGYPRVGGLGYGGSLCDIGAYEYGTSPRVVQFTALIYSVNEGAGSATITVVLSPASGSTITVDYATSGGTATPGSDYTAQSGSLTFDPGITRRTIAVPILDDGLDETDETVILTLSNPTNADLGGSNPASLTIEDDDPLPTLHFSPASYSVDEGAGSATITVHLTPASARLVEVDCATSDGTATAGSDYTATSERLYFYPGVTSRTVSVPIIDDAQDEPDETVHLTLSGATNATIGGTNPALLTIADNDEADILIYLPLLARNGSVP